MSEQADFPIVETLKGAMKARGLRLTNVAQLTGIPYRSLQNYFSRKTEMPATTYLRLCAALGLDPDYVRRQRFDLDQDVLRKAIVRSLGPLVPTYVFYPNGSLGPEAASAVDRTEQQILRDAGTLAHVLAGAYDVLKEAELQVPLDPSE